MVNDLAMGVERLMESNGSAEAESSAENAALTESELVAEGGGENGHAKEIVRLAIQALQDKKAQDIHVIDISQVSVVADYFVIAGGTNKNQIQALCDHVQETLGRAGYPERQIEGYSTANWVLMDFNDVIVHIFDRENRLLYDLERIWRDGRLIDISDMNKA